MFLFFSLEFLKSISSSKWMIFWLVACLTGCLMTAIGSERFLTVMNTYTFDEVHLMLIKVVRPLILAFVILPLPVSALGVYGSIKNSCSCLRCCCGVAGLLCFLDILMLIPFVIIGVLIAAFANNFFIEYCYASGNTVAITATNTFVTACEFGELFFLNNLFFMHAWSLFFFNRLICIQCDSPLINISSLIIFLAVHLSDCDTVDLTAQCKKYFDGMTMTMIGLSITLVSVAVNAFVSFARKKDIDIMRARVRI